MFSINVWKTRHYTSDRRGQPTANSKSLVQRQRRTDDQVSWVAIVGILTYCLITDLQNTTQQHAENDVLGCLMFSIYTENICVQNATGAPQIYDEDDDNDDDNKRFQQRYDERMTDRRFKSSSRPTLRCDSTTSVNWFARSLQWSTSDWVGATCCWNICRNTHRNDNANNPEKCAITHRFTTIAGTEKLPYVEKV